MHYGKRTCVLVVGMHRSGTSALAGTLRYLGVDFGDDLLPPGPDNQRGYIEHSAFFKANVSFLESMGLDGDGRLRELPHDWLVDERTIVFKQTLHALFEQYFKDAYIFGVKDPRISILLPVYLDVLNELGIDIRVVVSVRDIGEVATSLKKRNNTPIADSVMTYAYYYRTITYYVQDIKHVYVAYHDLLERTEYVVNQLVRTIHPALRPYSDVANTLETYLSTTLRHHVVDTADFIVSLAKNAREYTHDLEQTKKSREKDLLWWNEHVQQFTEQIRHAHERVQQIEAERESIHREAQKQKAQHEADVDVLNQRYVVMKKKYHKSVALHETYKHEQHLEYLKADAHRVFLEDTIKERDAHIEMLHIMLTNIERSLVWKAVRAWEHVIQIVLPKGSAPRRWYMACIHAQQHFFNDWLPERVVRLLKQKNVPVVAKQKEQFWDTFMAAHPVTDIVFVGHDESRTGAPRILFDIAQSVQEKYRVAMVSLKDGSMHKEFIDTFGPVIYPDTLYPHIDPYKQAVQILERVQPRLVYVNSIASYQFARAAKALGIPTIFHVHELDIAFQIVFNRKEREQFHTFADTFITVSEPVRQLLVDRLACNPEQVLLLHEFVNKEKIEQLATHIHREIIYRELDMDPGDVLIIAVGTFIYRKGADMFMKMAKALHDRGVRATCVWIGSKPFKEPFMADFETYAPYFTLISEKVNPFPYIAAADMLVLPSREDPFPLVVLEAMALGKPSVVFKEGGGIADAVQDAGIVVQEMNIEHFIEAVTRMVTHDVLREAMGIKARQYQQSYDSSVLLPQFHQCIDRMITDISDSVIVDDVQ